MASSADQGSGVCKQAQYWDGDKSSYTFVPVSAFEANYRASGLGQEAEAAVKAPPRQAPEGKDALVRDTYAMTGA